MKTIWFDMDGTLVNFYAVENWLEYLNKQDTTPYTIAKASLNLSLVARLLRDLQFSGKYRIGIISWLSKNGTDDFNTQVIHAKKAWLKKHLQSVNFYKVIIVKYGTPKVNYKKEGDILFDDELNNREAWGDNAYLPDQIIEILKQLKAKEV